VKLGWRPLDLTLRRTFAISHGATDVRHNVLVELEVGGVTGLGEAEPTGYYGETAESAIAALEAFDPEPLEAVAGDDDIADIIAACREQLGKNVSVVAALDAALWDIRGKQLALPVWELLGAPGESSAPTSYTIAFGDPDTMAREAKAASEFERLKIKVGAENDAACLAAVREVTDVPIRIDANAAWSADEAIERVGELMQFGIELVEQPCGREDIDGLRRVREAIDVPVIADESCHTSGDVDALVGAVDGINIKLVKSGGLAEAARIVDFARRVDLRVMIGCMTSSSLAITTAAHVAGWAGFVDLDGNLLIQDDPFRGAIVEDGLIRIPRAPGLGVERMAGS